MTNSSSHQSFFNQFSKLFDDIFSKDFNDLATHWNLGIYIPAVNIKETAKGFDLEMTAPGREKADFNIQFNNDRLSISVPKKAFSKLEDQEKFVRKEFAYPPIHRHFNFTRTKVNDKNITAKYENGILKVFLPKVEKEEQHKGSQIKVD